MNPKILNTLEFSKIKQQIQQFIVTDSGQQIVTALQPSSSFETVQKTLDQTKDGVEINRIYGELPIPRLVSIEPHLKRLKIGASLNGLELAQICRVLRAGSYVVDFFAELDTEKITLKNLDQLVLKIEVLPQLTRKLVKAVSDDGSLLDSASDKLAGLRRGIQQLSSQIRSQMDELTRGSKAQYMSEPIVTIRNDRYVVPVKQEYRYKFGGVVHDQSASGQTLFMEPKLIVNLNNRLREEQISEEQEIQRLLGELSEMLAPHIAAMHQTAYVLGQLDFINAKAKYARLIKASEPIVNQEQSLHLKQARHPLIDAKKVVPNDISIGEDYQAIVVTGPNTGGKTITLKTLGLLQLMGQAGLFIPANEESQIAIFDDIFADIGDEQSIEQNLSTFSAHMENIISILKAVNQNSLVLFDELGAGTDPQEGAALAIAILDKIGETGANVMASTHYPELKIYGYNRPQTINASMEFDVKTLQPTYRLLIGVPGRSNAFEIAQRLGLEETVVTQAKQLMGRESQDLNNMISDLQNQQKKAHDEYQSLQQELASATQLQADLTQAFQDFEQDKAKQLQTAKQAANEIVEKAREKSEAIIADLRKQQLNRSQPVKENELIAAKGQLNALTHTEDALKKNRVLKRAKAKQSLKVGDDVLVTSYDQRGTILRKVDDQHFEVQIGIMKLRVAKDELEKQVVTQAKQTTQHVKTVNSGGIRHVKAQLDLRGQRYEEAMGNLDQYLDAALLANYQQVTIVHGMGTGAIRNGVQEALKRHKQVQKYAYAPANAGGFGATIVTFKG